jgi:hypothetical protein
MSDTRQSIQLSGLLALLWRSGLQSTLIILNDVRMYTLFLKVMALGLLGGVIVEGGLNVCMHPPTVRSTRLKVSSNRQPAIPAQVPLVEHT